MKELDDYQRLASRTSQFREGDYLNGKLYALDWNVHGLTGEAGEVADMIKKVHMHGHTFDKDKLIRELGDILWYVSECARMVGCPLSEVAERNIAKLKQRYPDGFDAEKSKNRKNENDVSSSAQTGSGEQSEENNGNYLDRDHS